MSFFDCKLRQMFIVVPIQSAFVDDESEEDDLSKPIEEAAPEATA